MACLSGRIDFLSADGKSGVFARIWRPDHAQPRIYPANLPQDVRIHRPLCGIRGISWNAAASYVETTTSAIDSPNSAIKASSYGFILPIKTVKNW